MESPVFHNSSTCLHAFRDNSTDRDGMVSGACWKMPGGVPEKASHPGGWSVNVFKCRQPSTPSTVASMSWLRRLPKIPSQRHRRDVFLF